MLTLAELNPNKPLNHFHESILKNNKDLIDTVQAARHEDSPYDLITKFAIWNRPLSEFLDRLKENRIK